MEQINSYYKKKIVDISGNICNAIEYYDGTQFIEPFFDGETVGWVRDVFINHTKKSCEIQDEYSSNWFTCICSHNTKVSAQA